MQTEIALRETYANGGITINRAPQIHRCERLWSWDPPPLTDFDLWIVQSGIGTLKIGNRIHLTERGFAALFTPQSAPSAQHDPDNRLTVFAVHFSFHSPEAARVPLSTQLLTDMNIIDHLIGRIMRLYRFESDPSMTEITIALWDLLFCCFSSQNRKKTHYSDSRIAGIVARIDEDPSIESSIDEMADGCNLSRAQFVRIFRGVMGASPHRYRLLKRIERAKTLLQESSLSAEQVGEALGYADPAYFCRQFRREVGVPPGKFRNGLSNIQPVGI